MTLSRVPHNFVATVAKTACVILGAPIGSRRRQSRVAPAASGSKNGRRPRCKCRNGTLSNPHDADLHGRGCVFFHLPSLRRGLERLEVSSTSKNHGFPDDN